MNTGEPYILLFDGVCNLCNSSVQFIIKRDKRGKFKYAALQSASGQALLKKFNLHADAFDTFILVQGDTYFTRSSAALHIFKELGGFWKLFYVFIILPAPLRNFIYNLVAKNRYKVFGRRDACMIPTPDIKSRFLD